MRTQRNIQLADLTTFHVGGPVELFCIPETIAELLESVEKARTSQKKVRVIGRGSNLLVSDRGIDGYLFKLHACCGDLEHLGAGLVRAGSGVPLQKFIGFCISKGLFGNEYLASVPGTIGGAIAMNAGGGMHQSDWVSNHLKEVVAFDGEGIRTLSKEECAFGFRRSVFQTQQHWIILSATFDLPEQSAELGIQKRRERIDWSLQYQDLKYSNAGSVFVGGSGRIFNIQRGWRLRRAGWSRKSGNWINNYGGASFREIMLLIKVSSMLNRFVRRRAKLEIRVWE